MKNTPSRQLLAIGQLSQLTGASVRSIRHYDEHGLLTSVRASNGYRMFPEKAVTQVKQIQRMIATGFTIDDIRGFPDCMLLIEGARSCDQITDVQRARLEAIERQIADLEKRRVRLLKTLNEGVIPPVD
ncbi:MerR family transcriptional regulator [Burkholderia multivorans]|jgi:DNA-binding transcriptional MerR regulator|uniref:MerR family transcriptional regulator n=1 Tax=Burkholderia multivorans TaxID=87883 RepID=UPI00057D5936|nr:MerR family transcriptional regulator [Burkholderia multivorans]KHS10223.1 MerR family transcriptional regulator [Burkholderia multivorans]KHS14784.1 MerR family transcriptional regulator [Burkholderia multivorans]MBR7923593.1 MerR family transcriptional regulator [Burkholderia multivorans]MBR8105008.1 MerR family transcriptional regulator [Burkholderia multivorans]MBU9429148.1 MerR family transcriptional regulator [Burkholderia multivorans]